MTDEAGTNGRRRVIGAILVLALAMRVGTGIWRGEALLQAGNGLYYMHDLAASLSQGGDYAVDGVTNVFQQPGYVFALALGYAVLGPTWHAVLLVNTVIGVGLAWLTMRLAGRLDVRAVVPAGLIAACHPVLVWHGGSVADTTLFSLAMVGWLDATLAAMRDEGRWPALWAGIWLGVGVLTRPSIVPLVPFGLLGLWWATRSWRRTGTVAAISLVVAGAMALPWAVRNHALTGKFPLIGTHGPESVWAANSSDSHRATELDSSYDAVSERYYGTELDVGAFQVDVPPREAIEWEERFRTTASDWVKAHPGTFLSMCIVRFGRIWDVRYHPTHWWDKPLPGLARKKTIHLLAHTPTLLLAIAGAVLLLRSGRRRPETLLVIAMLALYTGSHCIGAGYSRVRVPIDPLLAALAGAAVAYAPLPPSVRRLLG